MQFSAPLIAGTLLRRYKRFLCDVRLDSGETITATCPNTGSMLGLTAPGSRVWLSRSSSATRKYPHTWEMIEVGEAPGVTLVGINSHRPNAIVAEGIGLGTIAELAGYAGLRREVKYGRNSRIDLLLEGGPDNRPCYVEVKNVHFSRTPGLAEFPDSRTERGTKHLGELSDMVAAGHRAVMLYLIQRGDAEAFTLAADIDPAYAEAYLEAKAAGVEMLAFDCMLAPEGIFLDAPVAIVHPQAPKPFAARSGRSRAKTS